MDRIPPEQIAPVPGVTATPLPHDVFEPIVMPAPRARKFDLVMAAAAWLVIVGLIGYLVYRNMTRPAAAGGDDTSMLVNVESQGRYFVGSVPVGEFLKKLDPAAGAQLNKAELAKAAKTMNRGSYSQRIRYVVLVGELEGPTRAREELGKLELDRESGKLAARDISVEAVKLLDRLYKGYEKDTTEPVIALTGEEQQKLRDGLRWYGELALAPEGAPAGVRDPVMNQALRTAIAYMAVGVFIVLALVGGVALLLVAATLIYSGKLRSGLTTGATRGGVYAETFALYMLLYFGMGMGARYLDLGSYSILAALAAMLLSLVALAWPVVRGVSWRQVREDIGLTFGDRPRLNVVLGALAWIAAIPLVAIGVIIMFSLMRLLKMDTTNPASGPSHPIIGVALQKDWWVWVQVFLVAAVGAPIVEEIMFRGVLYRHLREGSGALGARWSILVSVLVSGFIFAVIHPQGWLGVPVLMALATAFALAREWRKTLVPPMVAHALNNGFAMLMLFFMAG